MLWGKSKTILIYFFVVINIFLCGVIFYSAYMQRNTQNAMYDNLARLLSNNGIEIERSLLINVPETLPLYDIKLLTATPVEMAEIFLGTSYSPYNHTGYKNGDKTITFENGSFTFTDDSANTESQNKLFHSNADKYMENFFKQNKLNFKNLYIFKDEIADNKFMWEQRYNNYKFFNSYLQAEFNGETICKITGTLIFSDIIQNSEVTLRPLIDILINYMNYIEKPENKTIQISRLELGYYINCIREQDILCDANPVWVIEDNLGNTTVYNAITAIVVE